MDLSGELSNFSLGSLIVSGLFGIVGIYYFRFGKRDGNAIRMLSGIGLMVYSFFVKGMAANLVAGLAIAALPFLLGRLGIDF